jgi:hypothetical protein
MCVRVPLSRTVLDNPCVKEGEGGLSVLSQAAGRLQKHCCKLCVSTDTTACTVQVEESQPYIVQYGQERLPKYMQVCGHSSCAAGRNN